MRTVQMTLDDELVQAVDSVVRKLKTTRSEFTRRALRQALEKVRIRELEEAHKAGYQNTPASQKEFSVWESEQEWGDA